MQSSKREGIAGGGENEAFDADKIASALSKALRDGDTGAIEQWIDEELAADVAEALTELEPEQARRARATGADIRLSAPEQSTRSGGGDGLRYRGRAGRGHAA